MKTRTLIGLAVAVVHLASCASTSPERPEVELEYIDRAEVVRQEVAAHPTQFVTQESVYSIWKRAELFSNNYMNISSEPKVLRPPSKSGFHMQHTPKYLSQKDQYGYEVIADPTNAGYQVKVNVVDLRTRKRNANSELVAKNLARFLKTGTLERSLLTP